MADAGREFNRAWWDERVPLHLGSTFYDLPGFRGGRSTLAAYELAESGLRPGQELLHLQCHIGLDTLSWARLGARVTGYDFSAPALRAAGALAGKLGLAAEFVEGEMESAAEILGRQFDLVYTGKGALIWLPDLQPWARAIARLLCPGGCLYLVEFHPLTDVMAWESLDFERDYEEGAEAVYDEPGDYAEPKAETVHNRCHQWLHTLGGVVSALAEAGLRVELLRERSETYFARFPPPILEAAGPGLWLPPPGRPRLPLVYSLRARRPGG
ncbi:MAG: class I SAM-dependent methyltransferase [Candidatus Dormibacteria bacterium]